MSKNWRDRIRPLLRKLEPAAKVVETATEVLGQLQKPTFFGITNAIAGGARSLAEELGRRVAAATRVPYRVLFGRDDWDDPIKDVSASIERVLDSTLKHRRPRPVCNRHDRERWLRKFREVARVAHDAMLSDERGRAIGVLTELLQLEDAVALCSPRRTLSDYVTLNITYNEARSATFPEELPSYPTEPHDDAVDVTRYTPYTNAGIPLIARAFEGAVMERERQESEDREHLNRWAARYGLRREDGETDDALRERMRWLMETYTHHQGTR